jgi:hypothetical protein
MNPAALSMQAGRTEHPGRDPMDVFDIFGIAFAVTALCKLIVC